MRVEMYPVSNLVPVLEQESIRKHSKVLPFLLFEHVRDSLEAMFEQAKVTSRAQWYASEKFYINYSYVATLLESHLRKLEEKSSRLARSFHASGTGDCLRMRSYPLVGAVPQRDFVAAHYLSTITGNFIHEALQKLMSGIPDLLVKHDGGGAIELNLDLLDLPEDLRQEFEETLTSCRVDMVKQGKVAPVVGDIKSIEDEKYWKASWDVYYESKKQHWAKQVGKGIHFYRDPQGRKARSGLILEVGRNSFAIREWAFHFEDIEDWLTSQELPSLKRARKMVEAFKRKYQPGTFDFSQALSGDELPAPEPGDNCKFCGYKEMCPR